MTKMLLYSEFEAYGNDHNFSDYKLDNIFKFTYLNPEEYNTFCRISINGETMYLNDTIVYIQKR